MARMPKKILKSYQSLLLKKQEEIQDSASNKKVAMENGENSRKGDWIDQSSEDNDIYINIRLRQTDTKVLRAIEDALQRIENRTYGICEDCKELIVSARLNAVPWARVCISCKEKQGG